MCVPVLPSPVIVQPGSAAGPAVHEPLCRSCVGMGRGGHQAYKTNTLVLVPSPSRCSSICRLARILHPSGEGALQSVMRSKDPAYRLQPVQGVAGNTASERRLARILRPCGEGALQSVMRS